VNIGVVRKAIPDVRKELSRYINELLVKLSVFKANPFIFFKFPLFLIYYYNSI